MGFERRIGLIGGFVISDLILLVPILVVTDPSCWIRSSYFVLCLRKPLAHGHNRLNCMFVTKIMPT